MMNRTISLILTAVLLQATTLAACGGTGDTPDSSPGGGPAQSGIPTPARAEQSLEARVTAELFSGRPDPEWTLNPAESDELSQRMGFLMPTNADPPPDGLGYRGIVVRVDATNAVGAASLRAYGKTIYYTVEDISTGEPNTTPLHDPGGTLETWLLSTGEPHMDEATYAEVAAAIDALRADDAGADGDPADGDTGESEPAGDGSAPAEPTALPPPTNSPTP